MSLNCEVAVTNPVLERSSEVGLIDQCDSKFQAQGLSGSAVASTHESACDPAYEDPLNFCTSAAVESDAAEKWTKLVEMFQIAASISRRGGDFPLARREMCCPELRAMLPKVAKAHLTSNRARQTRTHPPHPDRPPGNVGIPTPTGNSHQPTWIS